MIELTENDSAMAKYCKIKVDIIIRVEVEFMRDMISMKVIITLVNDKHLVYRMIVVVICTMNQNRNFVFE